jgi:hypothetical protein
MRRLLLLSSFVVGAEAAAQTVPRRQIPPSVLTELALLEQRFELALAGDCHPELCWSKGCAYGDHAVLDRPRAASLPGLGDGTGPGTVLPQEFLTQATCAFAYEPSVTQEEAEALGRRLQSKVSHGFTVVSVSRQELLPLPEALEKPPAPPEPEEAPPPPPPQVPRWTAGVAARELWTTLLPVAPWVAFVSLLTASATVLFWAWRRVGRETVEEKALLAQLLREEAAGGEGEEEGVAGDGDEVDDFVRTETSAWRRRFEAAAPGVADPELTGLVRELLHDQDWPTLCKAALDFPPAFLAAFPAGGDVAAAKLELADRLKTITPDELPSDEDFYRALSRVSRSAALSGQDDARLIRSLREEFGAAGLAALVAQVPARAGALLYALAPTDQQLELVRLVAPDTAARLASQLMRSDRMDDAETGYLFALLEAARAGDTLPDPPEGDVSERGTTFDAAGPLSALLPALPSGDRATLFADAVDRFHGTLPAWFRGIVFPDLLRSVPAEARADVFLAVDADELGAWVALQPADAKAGLLEGLPRALRVSLETAPGGPREQQLARASAARVAVARGLQRHLAQQGLRFEDLVTSGVPAEGGA